MSTIDDVEIVNSTFRDIDNRAYTDVTFGFEGHSYGCRFHGWMTKHEITQAAYAFLARRHKERSKGQDV